MLRIGLTGGIGSGKSLVCDLFAAHGVPVIDSDAIAREIVAPGSELAEAVIREFGESFRDVTTGGLDRKGLRRLVFANSQARHRLEAMLHPKIVHELSRRQTGVGAPYCILSIPLLVESGLQDQVDRILVIDCPEASQVERVMHRDGVSRQETQAILASQASRDERLAHADDVIDNSGPPGDLDDQVAELHRKYLELAADGKR
ncbi:dephospho-CoA kinase [Thioalkalivibrio denitrificans]|uniref:Dephospho-CoA kinase n=1 Tax=Thioalkalivibrio denitrificans TaxID=108003 RepID=A0A1V3NF98_9GAMM|nr:dephospho-CoA kinase [Thioalkalivibrio denitrificans]OOG23603.1 dephospho-CoA kinase [Thioalkalivibrio denitrificans]